ncbi:MAG: hypothetical protein HOV94_01145, partial [Saccharothrix sp.]|nr:hypothetical protein [Saccharothrix sp.]
MTLPALNELESRFVHHAHEGLRFECGRIKVDALAATRDNDHDIRMEVVQKILSGDGPSVHPGGLRIRYARITGSAGQPLCLNGLRLPVGVEFRDCCFQMPVLAHDAHIPWLNFDDCRVGYLQADRIVVKGSLYLRGLVTTMPHDMGSVRLLGARIGRNLELDKACLVNPKGPGLHAEGISVGRALRIRKAKVDVVCDTGAVQLVNARIDNDAWIDETHINNGLGPALNAEGLQVGGSLLLGSGFTATAESPELGTVHLMSSRVGSRLDLGAGRRYTGIIWGENPAEWKPSNTPATLSNTASTGLVLDLSCASTNDLRLPPQVVCEPDDGWCSTGNKVILVGLKYTTLSRESTHQRWPHLLGHHVDHFEAEPYQHLATVLRGSGQAGEARKLLIELENERHRWRSRPVSPGSSAWHWTKRIVIRHGYKPGRALFFLLGVFGFALLLSLAARSADWVHRPAIRVEGQATS